MLLAGIHFPDAALEEQARVNGEQLLNGADPLYEQLAVQTAQAVEQQARQGISVAKQTTTGFMPVAYFSMRAAVQTVRHPEIAPLLPSPVELRGGVIQRCAALMTTYALHSGALLGHYTESEALAPLMSKTPIGEFLQPNTPYAQRITLLGKVAINDETIVAGGALRFLKRVHPKVLKNEPAAAIVGRSTGLQLIARVPDARLEDMRTRFGLPYVGHEHLTFRNNAVDFTDETRKFLHGLMKSGVSCPAHFALTEGASAEPTFLRLVWADLAEALLPPRAKAEIPPTSKRLQPDSRKRKS